MLLFVYGSLLDDASRTRTISRDACAVVCVATLPRCVGYIVEPNVGSAKGPVYLGLRRSARPLDVHGIVLYVKRGIARLRWRERKYTLRRIGTLNGKCVHAFVPRTRWQLAAPADERMSAEYRQTVCRGAAQHGLPSPVTCLSA